MGWINRGRASPFVGFTVTIHKREAAGAIMVGAGDVRIPRVRVDAQREKASIDGIRLFINAQPGHRRFRDLGLFQKLLIVGINPGMAGVDLFVAVNRFIAGQTQQTVHGIAPQTGGKVKRPLITAQIIIRRTFVNPKGTGGIGCQDTFPEPVDIRVAQIGDGSANSPRHDIVNPISKIAVIDRVDSALDAEVVAHVVGEIQRIHVPTGAQLLVIAEANDGLGFRFGPA